MRGILTGKSFSDMKNNIKISYIDVVSSCMVVWQSFGHLPNAGTTGWQCFTTLRLPRLAIQARLPWTLR